MKLSENVINFKKLSILGWNNLQVLYLKLGKETKSAIFTISCAVLSIRLYEKTLIDNITNAIGPISHLSDDKLVNLLLYGSDRYNTEQNSFVLKNTIVFLKSSERFDIPLL